MFMVVCTCIWQINELNMHNHKKFRENKWKEKKSRKNLQSKQTKEEENKQLDNLDYFAGRFGEGDGCRITGRPDLTFCIFLSSHDLKTSEIVQW